MCIFTTIIEPIILQQTMKLVQKNFAHFEINSQNLSHNFSYFKSKLNQTTKLLILIKANSYGHGAVEFAKTMENAGADYFGVAHPIEGIELRENGINHIPILILTAGYDYFKEIVNYNLEPSIPSIEMLMEFNNYLESRQIENYPVHIKLDTGMHRLGFMEKDLHKLSEFLKKPSNIQIKSIFSHLAASDEPDNDNFTLGQIELFEKLYSQITSHLQYKPIKHILNSAGIERFTQYQFDMVRLGIGIYGISAVEEEFLKPAAEFSCKIIQIKELTPEDGTVGYGRHGKIDSAKRIATLPLGYADGINRKLGRGNAKFMVNGKLAPTIGNICMDMCMIDITGIDANVGDKVTIFGENPTARELARILGTIPYEIFTSVSKRVRR